MEIGMVERVDIDQEMQQAYLDYAMSVIVARALPDARDGLKPVHRRILYAMYDMGLRPETSFKKSARIVGEVLGKYHPHGDMAVYDAMARMAQDFSMRYLLVDGQGNFGSLDGDPPAAMRYTEARLSTASIRMLTDISKNTVNFHDNFDGTLSEPDVLPASIPNLLVNGATGIAVGMATSIPPHNLGEVVDALQHLLKYWEKLDDISVEDLLEFVKGPDFPTGGVIIQGSAGDGLVQTYSTGRGKVTVQASAHLEEMERGRSRIIVTELPYMTNKSSLIERIAELTREEKIEGIVDLRDESDRQGMRIVIELSKAADPDSVLRSLYRQTPMQATFSIIMLALVNGEPRHLSLKQALRVFLEHRLEIVRRRFEFDLEKARQRAHILEGLQKAIRNLDDVIAIIRRSADADIARTKLMKALKISEIQAQAILDMPLKRLAALERRKIDDELRELQAQIKNLENLLRSPKKMRQQVSDELQEVKDQFSDRRRTHIVLLKEGETKSSLLTKSDLVEEKEIWVSVDASGLISRSSNEKPPQLSGRDAPRLLLKTNTRDVIYLASESGEAAAVPVHALPEADDSGQGGALHKHTPFRDGTELAGLFSLPSRSNRDEDDLDGYIVTITRAGMIKKSQLADLPGASAGLFTLVKVNEGDRLGWCAFTNGQNEILMATANGMAIRFHEESVRPMGLVAAGVMGIKLQNGDKVIGVDLLPNAGEVFLVSSKGRAKRVAADQFPTQGRYGQGVTAWKLASGDNLIGMTIGKGNTQAILHFNKLASKSIRLDTAPLQTRAARGGAIYSLKIDQQITSLTAVGETKRAGGSKSRTGGSAARAAKKGQTTKTIKNPAAARSKHASTTGSKSKTSLVKKTVVEKSPSSRRKTPAVKKAPAQLKLPEKPDEHSAKGVNPPAKKPARKPKSTTSSSKP